MTVSSRNGSCTLVFEYSQTTGSTTGSTTAFEAIVLLQWTDFSVHSIKNDLCPKQSNVGRQTQTEIINFLPHPWHAFVVFFQSRHPFFTVGCCCKKKTFFSKMPQGGRVDEDPDVRNNDQESVGSLIEFGRTEKWRISKSNFHFTKPQALER